MRLNIRAFMLTFAILWAAAVLFTGIANLFSSEYGTMFLQLMAPIYPGYDASRTFGSVIVGTLYAVVDGAICGLVFAWLYNFLLGKGSLAKEPNRHRSAQKNAGTDYS